MASASTSAAVEPAKDTIDDMLLLSALREEGKAELLDILDSIRGRKCLVTDAQLGGLLSQIIVEGSKFLHDNDVDYLRELKDEGLKDFTSVQQIGENGQRVGVADIPENIVYIVRPHLPLMNLIANQINEAAKNGITSTFHVYFVPQQFTVCLHLLEELMISRTVFDQIRFGEYKLGLIPFDTDILSLEMDGCFKQCSVDGDLSSLTVVAQALLKIQMLFGVIPNVRSKGHCAKKVLQKLMSLRVEEVEQEQKLLLEQQSSLNTTQVPTSNGDVEKLDGEAVGHNKAKPIKKVADKYNPRSEIDLLVILDRDVDLISPLVTPLTYEGLIDDTVGIEKGRVRLDAAVLGSAEQQDAMSVKMAAQSGTEAAAAAAVAASANASRAAAGDKIPVMLNNNDAIFAEIRDLSIETLGAYLQDKAIHIRERYTTFKENKDASITEIHDFVKKIPKLTLEYKSLNQHINIAEMLKQRTDSRAFLSQWQDEHAILEGESHMDEIEEILCADVSRSELLRVLRLLCLQSLTAGGIRTAKYDNIRRLISHNYGYQHLFTLANLEKAGLIKRKDTLIVVEISSQWTQLRKQLRLIEEREDNVNQDSISYVSAGYAPMLVRLVQLLGHNGISWNCIADTLRQLPGPVLEFTQSSTPEHLSEALERSAHESGHFGSSASTPLNTNAPSSSGFGASALSPNNLLSGIIGGASIGGTSSKHYNHNHHIEDLGNGPVKFSENGTADKKTMLLFVVGGLSFIEIAAFRFLSKDPSFPYRIMSLLFQLFLLFSS